MLQTLKLNCKIKKPSSKKSLLGLTPRLHLIWRCKLLEKPRQNCERQRRSNPHHIDVLCREDKVVNITWATTTTTTITTTTNVLAEKRIVGPRYMRIFYYLHFMYVKFLSFANSLYATLLFLIWVCIYRKQRWKSTQIMPLCMIVG